MQDTLWDRGKAHATEDAEELLMHYQDVQCSMEDNSANLTDEWYIDQQMTTELEKFNLWPHNEMVDVRNLRNNCMGPSS